LDKTTKVWVIYTEAEERTYMGGADVSGEKTGAKNLIRGSWKGFGCWEGFWKRKRHRVTLYLFWSTNRRP